MKKEYDYFEYRKKFCNRKIIRQIRELSERWLITPAEVCTRIITTELEKEIEKKKEVEEYKNKKPTL